MARQQRESQHFFRVLVFLCQMAQEKGIYEIIEFRRSSN